MESPNKDRKTAITLVNICRVLLALVMMLSGFLKAADPVGAMYKLQEYATILSIGELTDGWLLAGAVVQSAFEFLIGLYLLVGVYRRGVPLLALIAMLLFTPLSLYLWLSGTIDDCGCFGEAVIISNRATFIKNIVLLALAFVVYFGRGLFVRTMSRKCRWVLVLFSVVYIFSLQAIAYNHLPVIDFGHYAPGENLREKVAFVPDEYEYQRVYQKDSVQCVLPADTVPGSDWVFIEERPLLVKRGREPQIRNFSIVNWEYDIEIADELLADTGYVCLVVIEQVEEASVTHVDKLNDLYDHCVANGITFCAVTSSDDDNELELWSKRTGAEYPLYWAEASLLHPMIRSNPGLLLLNDGVIVGKWNVSDIPDLELLEASPTLMPDAVWSSGDKMLEWPFWVVLLFGVLFMLALLDFVLVAVARRKSVKALEMAKAATAKAPEAAQELPVEAKTDNETSDIN